MNSKELKQMFKDEGIFMWEIAKVLKIHEVTFGKWFREDTLSKEREQLVLTAVEKIKSNRLELQKNYVTENNVCDNNLRSGGMCYDTATAELHRQCNK